MSYIKPNKAELTFASRLLRYLHANAQNGYLVLAVIAWLRSESGRNYRGNNPLNIRRSPYAIGYRKAGNNGSFAIFASLDMAAKASARFLLSNKGNGYELMIATLRRGGTPAQFADIGTDFLRALAKSKWSSGHYGLKGAELTDNNAIYKTTLFKVYSSLTGHPFTIPAYVKPPPKPPPAPRQPRSLRHTISEREYIEPYAAESFYEGRLRPETALPDVPLTLGE